MVPDGGAEARPVLRLLLVEDDEDDAFLIQRTLKQAGYQLTSQRVASAAALREALTAPWDLVTCDWKMPAFSGEEALRIIAAAAIDAPVILVSGEVGEDFAVMAMRAGAHDFVSKNRLSQLEAAVERGRREADGRRAQRRMEEALGLQAAIMGNLPLGVALVRADDLVIVHANPKYEQMFGYAAGELGGRPISLLHAAEAGSPTEVADTIEGQLRATGAWEGDIYSRRKDGMAFWSHARIAGFEHPEHGRVWVWIQGDVSERKALDAALERERIFLGTLVDAIPYAVFVKDPDGRYLACNAAAALHAGVDRAAVIGRTDAEIFPLAFAALARASDLEAIAARAPTRERARVTVGGGRRALEMIKTPMYDAAGQLLGVLGVAHDVTADAELEANLRQRLAAQEQLTRTAATVPGVIASIRRRPDGTTAVPYASLALRDLFAIDPDDVREDASPVFARVHPEDAARARASGLESARALTPWTLAFRVRHPERGTIWVDGRAIPQREADGSVLWHGFFADATERRQADARARNWLRLFRAADFGLAQSEARTDTLIEVNAAFARQRGYTPDELAGRPVLELFPPAERERWQRIMAEIDATGHVAAETIHQRKDGTCFPVLVEVTAVRDATGAVASRIAYAADLSERQRLHDEERRHAEHYRAIAQTSFDAFWRVDAAGRILDVNEACCAMSGYSRDELLRMSVADVEAMMSPAEVVAHLADLRAGGAPRFETRHRRKDGSVYEVEVSLLVLEETDQYLGFLRDISARKAAARQLRETSMRFESTMHSMLEGLQIIGFDWRYLYVNPAAAAQSRRPAAELIGRTVTEVFPHIVPTEVFAAARRCMAERTPQHLEQAFTLPDGSHVWFELSIEPVREGIAILSVETTGRKRAEEQLRELNVELEERVERRTSELAAANQELEAFTYSVSHDLRAPLRAVDGFSRAVLEDFGATLPAEGRRLLEHVRGGAQRMSALLEQLLRLSRLGRQPLERGPVDCAGLVAAVVADLRAQREAPATVVRVGGLPPCDADRTLLRQVWVNLLDNAFKYSARAAAPVIEVGCDRRDGAAAYFVRDNGAGFDPAQAHRLFGLFQRLHPPDEFEGTGAGLAIVQRIVHRHGGRVWAEGAPGEGATFFFTVGAPDAAARGEQP